MTAISIDGPSRSGKTTLGLWLADCLRVPFLDTGLTFRGLAFLAATSHLPCDRYMLSALNHEMYLPGVSAERILVNGFELSANELRSPAVEAVLGAITSDMGLRQGVLEFHQDLIPKDGGIVAAGRDVGVSLLPLADLKILLLADEETRKNRNRESSTSGKSDGYIERIGRLESEAQERLARAPDTLTIVTEQLDIQAVKVLVASRLGVADAL